MSVRFDDKGKFFTDIVSKESFPVIIQTLTQRIRGQYHIRPGKRLIDDINHSDLFTAITKAIILDHSGNEIFRCDFLALNQNQIIWILPEDELQKKE